MNRGPKLEIRSRIDGAWYDGDLILEGNLVRVHFSGYSRDDDEVWRICAVQDKRSIIGTEKVRLRSRQFQDQECSSIKEGTEICAILRTDEFIKYYDAVLIKVKRTPHIHGVCFCSFQVAWKGGPREGQKAYLKCGDICVLRLNKEVLYRHPVIKMLTDLAGRNPKTRLSRVEQTRKMEKR
ncbi:hypothetical protein MPTK1_2g06440 [Marchantia polymorpha subsp. ruderalis]|uniref:SAWADEE domain-containing protein n=1 Tax=Marchantia polymorpha TaxID=3197 RepID=A0A2R6XDR4_MARPO|nr:hypothetical protein MARPO_0021s0099 [Marchantia polymorpha]BBN01318.1 hypothetical protein Mp_2g06440 [Marchantia polymorpha subsp. ruderalis]|eukprot:PTQ44243.1 hypothetical protein MARPO_0021s0099 [Marchantia polymorpha]